MEAWVNVDAYPARWNTVVVKGGSSDNSVRNYGMWVRDTGTYLLGITVGAGLLSNNPGSDIRQLASCSGGDRCG